MCLNRWVLDIAGGLSTEGLVQYVHLWDAVVTTQLLHQEEDQAVWKWNGDGVYTAASTCHMLWEGSARFSCAKPRWKSWATLNCKIFI